MVIEQYQSVKARIQQASLEAQRDPTSVALVAVSKTFAAPTICPLLEAGHLIFGENRVQEAQAKWPELRAAFPGVELHLIGPLQSNKAADAVALFDVIQTVDRPKIVQAIALEAAKQGRHIRCFVQVNTGDESQKAGVHLAEANKFITLARRSLHVVGLMCIPPVNDSAAKHFELLASLAERQALAQLSMGMSHDFESAIAAGATHVRVGSAIFGTRSTPQ